MIQKTNISDFAVTEFDVVDSTNTQAKKLVTELGANSHKNVIVSTKQTAGRGRYDRVWLSEDGNLFLTLVIKKSSVTKFNTNLLPIFVSKIIYDSTKIEGASCGIKWPNDILLDSKKARLPISID